MTPDHLAQAVIAALLILAVIYRRELAAFMDDCSNGNVERMARDEMATEARMWLERMK